MTVQNVLSSLLIPPASLIYAAAVGVVLAGTRRHARLGLVLCGLSLLLLFALGLGVVGEGLLVSLERDVVSTPPPSAPPGAIVILSGEVERTPAGLEPGPMTLQRLLAGARLWRQVQLPVLVSGGSLEPGEEPIALVMRRALIQDFNVPVRWVEPHSMSTWENAKDSAAILRPLGIGTVYLVTHAWHERRAMLAFRHFGLTPVPVSVPPDVVAGGLIPTVGGWSRSYYALHEWLGLLDYAVRAWLAGPPSPVPPSKSAP